CSQAQLECVVRTVHDGRIAFQSLKNRRRIPIIGALIAEWQPRRIVRMATHPHTVFPGDRNDSLKKMRDPLPIIVGCHFAGRSNGKFSPVALELERFIRDSAASACFAISPDGYHCPVIADDLYADETCSPDVLTNDVEFPIALRTFRERD